LCAAAPSGADIADHAARVLTSRLRGDSNEQAEQRAWPAGAWGRNVAH
jgi:hypothetical protein